MADARITRDEKRALRQKYKLLRAELDAELKSALDRRICENFLSLACYRYAETILMYAPTKSEIDIFPIARCALSDGKRIAFPLCNKEEKTMLFKLLSSLDELTVGAYGILEPRSDAETLKDFSHSVCIVPGLVFDKRGYRIGYGGGYYDRFLGDYRETKVGLIYGDFLLDRVPVGYFDRRVDIILTERGTTVANQK